VVKKEKIYEAEPIAIYDTLHLSAGGFKGATLDFGAEPDGQPPERLYDLEEPELVEKLALSRSSPLKSILEKLGIDYPRCWLALNVPKERLIRDWKYDKPGDVDIISGNIIENRCSFDYVVAAQVKVRKVKAPDELRYFPSGTGTRQSYYMALMGFDKTLFLHLIVREPIVLQIIFWPQHVVASRT
jgi:hypothetical protein